MQSLGVCLPESHHNWDAYMEVMKERKSTFFTALEYREKEAGCLFAANRGVGGRGASPLSTVLICRKSGQNP